MVWRYWKGFGDVGEGLEMLERVWSCWRGEFCRLCSAWGCIWRFITPNRRLLHAPRQRLLCCGLHVSFVASYPPAWAKSSISTQRESPVGASGTRTRGVSTLLKAWKKICRGKDTGLLNHNLLAEPRGSFHPHGGFIFLPLWFCLIL